MQTHPIPNDDLWCQYQADRHVWMRNALITRYKHLVHLHARKLARRLSLKVSVDEIASAAFDGLMGAVETYDPHRSVKFETYASKRIVGSVLDWLRSVDPQSRQVREFEKQRNFVKVLIGSDLGRKPTDAEIAERMSLSRRQYRRYDRRSRSGRFISLGHLGMARDSEGGETIGPDTVEAVGQAPPYAPLQRDMVREFICRGLDSTERHVLTLYYYDQLTMAEIGGVLSLSESRISQVHKQTLNKLKGRFGSPEAMRAAC